MLKYSCWNIFLVNFKCTCYFKGNLKLKILTKLSEKRVWKVQYNRQKLTADSIWPGLYIDINEIRLTKMCFKGFFHSIFSEEYLLSYNVTDWLKRNHICLIDQSAGISHGATTSLDKCMLKWIIHNMKTLNLILSWSQPANQPSKHWNSTKSLLSLDSSHHCLDRSGLSNPESSLVFIKPTILHLSLPKICTKQFSDTFQWMSSVDSWLQINHKNVYKFQICTMQYSYLESTLYV